MRRSTRRGFLLPAGFYWVVAGIVYITALGWGFIADHTGSEPPPVERWF